MSRYRQLFALILILISVATYIVIARPIRQGLDLKGGMRLVYEARPEDGKKLTPNARKTIVSILEKRANRPGVVEPVIQPKGENQFIVEIPDVKNKKEIADELSKPTKLEFRYFKKVKSKRNPGAPYDMNIAKNDKGADVITFVDPSGKEVPTSTMLQESESPLILTGADLKDNAKGDVNGARSVVSIEFKPEGAKKFAEFTRFHVGEILAIIYNGEVLSTPNIEEAILGGRAQISGNFTAVSAQLLADELNAGALPVPLAIVEQNIVEATLGQQYVTQSINAGLYGLALVVAFMIIYYLLPGLLATLALGMYALFTFAIFKLMGVTMTLPGLAGFILSIGMAVDANILIFERMKEELRAGKTLHSAIDAGFNRAWTAILDSNVCTLITCAVLIWLTTGPVVGFAKTLGIGVMVSMFTAITVTRTLLHLISNMGFAQNAKLYGLGLQWGTHGGKGGLDIIGKTPLWLTISGIAVVLGLWFLITGGLKPGIEFTGGSMMQVSFPSEVTTPGVVAVIDDAGYPGSQVQISRDNNKYVAYIRTKELSVEDVEKVQQALAAKFTGAALQSSSRVGASISKEITQKAIYAVVIGSLLICAYLSVRFAQGGFVEGFKFGACAWLALLHDVLVVLGASSLFGKLFGWEIDGSYVTAVLTMVGFSVHDTIVIFDRIRENMKLRLKGESFDQLVNRSILQSFARSINTSLTVVLVLTTLLILGGSVIKHFNAVLLVGIITGTYSSIFNASPLLVIWEKMARKSKSSPSAASLKPLVNAPSADVKRPERIVADGGNGKERVDVLEDNDTAGKVKPKTTVKRRKRRF